MRSLTNSALMETFCIHESEREKSGKTRPLYFCVLVIGLEKCIFENMRILVRSLYLHMVFQHFILLFL